MNQCHAKFVSQIWCNHPNYGIGCRIAKLLLKSLKHSRLDVGNSSTLFYNDIDTHDANIIFVDIDRIMSHVVHARGVHEGRMCLFHITSPIICHIIAI